MERWFIILIAGVIAAGAGTIVIAALMAPNIAGLPLAGPALLVLALVLLLAQRRRRR